MPVPGRIARRAAALCGTVALAMTVNAPPASAHETSLSLGANTASVTSGHTHVTVCDNEDDGKPVYAELSGHPLGGAPNQYFDVYGGSCSTYALPVPVWSFFWALCEPYSSCAGAFL
jgi:hypothetical protein